MRIGEHHKGHIHHPGEGKPKGKAHVHRKFVMPSESSHKEETKDRETGASPLDEIRADLEKWLKNNNPNPPNQTIKPPYDIWIFATGGDPPQQMSLLKLKERLLNCFYSLTPQYDEKIKSAINKLREIDQIVYNMDLKTGKRQMEAIWAKVEAALKELPPPKEGGVTPTPGWAPDKWPEVIKPTITNLQSLLKEIEDSIKSHKECPSLRKRLQDIRNEIDNLIKNKQGSFTPDQFCELKHSLNYVDTALKAYDDPDLQKEDDFGSKMFFAISEILGTLIF